MLFFSIGGKGNYYFLSNMNRAPTECELGANGDQKKYKLELQLIAHFGLVNNLVFNNHCFINIFFSLDFQMLVKVVFYELFHEHDPLLVIMNLPHVNHSLVQLNMMILYKFMV